MVVIKILFINSDELNLILPSRVMILNVQLLTTGLKKMNSFHCQLSFDLFPKKIQRFITKKLFPLLQLFLLFLVSSLSYSHVCHDSSICNNFSCMYRYVSFCFQLLQQQWFRGGDSSSKIAEKASCPRDSRLIPSSLRNVDCIFMFQNRKP